MKILFKYPSRSRPELFKRGIESIIDNCVSKNYIIIVSLDRDDIFIDNYKQMQLLQFLPDIDIFFRYGSSKNKIDAINRDITGFYQGWDIIICMSDDMIFNVKGFDEIIRRQFEIYLNGQVSNPEVRWDVNLDRCLHFPDGNRNDLITMSIMGRDYYNRFGYIYHPDYKSLYCDNEQTEVAKILGCYKYVDKQIFEHKHPAYGKASFDAQYQHTESFNEVDRQTYLRRKEMNFGL